MKALKLVNKTCSMFRMTEHKIACQEIIST